MPGKSDIPAEVKPGEPILAAWMNPLLQMARSHGQFAGSFQSSIFSLTRPLGVQTIAAPQIPLYGVLKEPIPAGGIVPDAIHACERVDGEYVLLFDEDDNPVMYYGVNMNSWTNINYYLDDLTPPLQDIEPFVWGFGYTKDVSETEEPDIRIFMEVWNPPMQIPMCEGFELAPANGVGQVWMHDHDSCHGVLRAGPCGGE